MLNQPTSSPMITRMFGFRSCWAEAGMLAIVVTAHNTTIALQIVLNILMVPFLDAGCWSSGRSLRPTPPANRDQRQWRITFRQSAGRLADGKLAETPWMRYALSAGPRSHAETGKTVDSVRFAPDQRGPTAGQEDGPEFRTRSL